MIELAAVPAIGRAAGVEPPAACAEAGTLARLYDRHSRRVLSFCLYRLRKQDDAEDAAQVTFLYALGALQRGVVPSSESAWLLKIADNVCLARFDATRRRRKLELLHDPSDLEEIAVAPTSDDREVSRLDHALAQLPARQRRAIVMREWQGLSYAEIAAELDLSHSAVETLIFRARQTLAAELRRQDENGRMWPLNLGSLLGWAKSLLGGGVAKVAAGAAGAAAIATLGAAGSEVIGRSTPTHAAATPAAAALGAAAGAPLVHPALARLHTRRMHASPAHSRANPMSTTATRAVPAPARRDQLARAGVGASPRALPAARLEAPSAATPAPGSPAAASGSGYDEATGADARSGETAGAPTDAPTTSAAAPALPVRRAARQTSSPTLPLPVQPVSTQPPDQAPQSQTLDLPDVPGGVPGVGDVPSVPGVPDASALLTAPSVPPAANVAAGADVSGLPPVPSVPTVPSASGVPTPPSVDSLPVVTTAAPASGQLLP